MLAFFCYTEGQNLIKVRSILLSAMDFVFRVSRSYRIIVLRLVAPSSRLVPSCRLLPSCYKIILPYEVKEARARYRLTHNASSSQNKHLGYIGSGLGVLPCDTNHAKSADRFDHFTEVSDRGPDPQGPRTVPRSGTTTKSVEQAPLPP